MYGIYYIIGFILVCLAPIILAAIAFRELMKMSGIRISRRRDRENGKTWKDIGRNPWDQG